MRFCDTAIKPASCSTFIVFFSLVAEVEYLVVIDVLTEAPLPPHSLTPCSHIPALW